MIPCPCRPNHLWAKESCQVGWGRGLDLQAQLSFWNAALQGSTRISWDNLCAASPSPHVFFQVGGLKLEQPLTGFLQPATYLLSTPTPQTQDNKITATVTEQRLWIA